MQARGGREVRDVKFRNHVKLLELDSAGDYSVERTRGP